MRSVLAGLVLVSAVAHSQPVVMDRLVAIVDGKPIVRSAVLARARPLLAKATTAEQKKQLEADTLTELVNEVLIANDADVLHVEVSNDEIESALAQVALSNGLTPDQLAAEVVKQGYTMPGYRSMLRQQLLQLRWLRLRKAEGVAADSQPSADFLEAEKKRLLTDLRARATIEVLP